jgi:hypothetical protein
VKKFERELQRTFPFASIEKTKSDHLRIRLPNGQSVFLGSTPSDFRTMKKVRSEVRRRMKRHKA